MRSLGLVLLGVALAMTLGAAPQIKWPAVDHQISEYEPGKGPTKLTLDLMGQDGWQLADSYTVLDGNRQIVRFVWTRQRWPK